MRDPRTLLEWYHIALVGFIPVVGLMVIRGPVETLNDAVAHIEHDLAKLHIHAFLYGFGLMLIAVLWGAMDDIWG